MRRSGLGWALGVLYLFSKDTCRLCEMSMCAAPFLNSSGGFCGMSESYSRHIAQNQIGFLLKINFRTDLAPEWGSLLEAIQLLILVQLELRTQSLQ